MAFIACPGCGYTIIAPTSDATCPSCGSQITSARRLPPASSVSQNSTAQKKQTGTTAEYFSSSATPPEIDIVIPAPSFSRKSRKRVLHDEDVFDDTTTVNSKTTEDVYKNGIADNASTGARRNVFTPAPPHLRGTLVHQYTQQADKTSQGFFSTLLRELGNIIWPVYDSYKRQDERKKTVTIARIRLEDGHQREARFEGDFKLGSVALGDELSLWGHKRKGTLIVERGYNHTTEAGISTTTASSGGGFTLLLIGLLLICTLVFFYMKGWLVLFPNFSLKLPF